MFEEGIAECCRYTKQVNGSTVTENRRRLSSQS